MDFSHALRLADQSMEEAIAARLRLLVRSTEKANTQSPDAAFWQTRSEDLNLDIAQFEEAR